MIAQHWHSTATHSCSLAHVAVKGCKDLVRTRKQAVIELHYPTRHMQRGMSMAVNAYSCVTDRYRHNGAVKEIIHSKTDTARQTHTTAQREKERYRPTEIERDSEREREGYRERKREIEIKRGKERNRE